MSDLTVNIAEGVVIRPGDVVLVTLPRDTDRPTLDRMRDQWNATSGGIKAMFVLGAESVTIQRQGHAVSRALSTETGEHLRNVCECGCVWDALDVMTCPRTAGG